MCQRVQDTCRFRFDTFEGTWPLAAGRFVASFSVRSNDVGKGRLVNRQEWMGLCMVRISTRFCFIPWLQHRSSPGAGGQERSEEDDGVDTRASLGGPIHVAEIQPESKFVEGEGCAHAVEDGHEAAEKDGRIFLAGADVGEPTVANEEENDNSENQMVNMAATWLDDEMERRDVMKDGVDDGANTREGEEETDRGDEQATARPVGDAFVEDGAEGSALQQEQQKRGSGNGKQEDEPGIGHRCGWG